MGSTTLTCGCTFQGDYEEVGVEWDEESYDEYLEKYVPATALASFCKPCADKGIKDGWLRLIKYDENGQHINQTEDRTAP